MITTILANELLIRRRPRTTRSREHFTSQRRTRMSAILTTHGVNDIITRAALKHIPAPPPTATWRPIAHYDLVQALDRQLAVRDIRIVKEELALAHEGLRLFGVLELEVPGTNGGSGRDYHFAMGIRTANDRS